METQAVNPYLHEVAITAIIIKDGEYFIDGIYDELVMAEKQRYGVKQEWSRA